MNIKEIIHLYKSKYEMPITLQVNLDKLPVCLSALVTAGGIPELVPAPGP